MCANPAGSKPGRDHEAGIGVDWWLMARPPPSLPHLGEESDLACRCSCIQMGSPPLPQMGEAGWGPASLQSLLQTDFLLPIFSANVPSQRFEP
jgi:hypothetical protein